MEWKKFKETEKKYPEEVISKLIKGFDNATNGLLDLVIQEQKEYLKSGFGDFQFRLILISNNLSKYKLEIMKCGYNVELYPTKIDLEDSIYEEIMGWSNPFSDPIKIESEKELEDIIKKIFDTKRFEEIVSGLMKISQKFQ
jgi:hypothetical protein